MKMDTLMNANYISSEKKSIKLEAWGYCGALNILIILRLKWCMEIYWLVLPLWKVWYYIIFTQQVSTCVISLLA